MYFKLTARSQFGLVNVYDASRSYHWIKTIFATISPNLSRLKSEERSPKKPGLT